MGSSALLINYTLQYKRGRRVITTFWYFLGSHVIRLFIWFAQQVSNHLEFTYFEYRHVTSDSRNKTSSVYVLFV
jgi:hypothetical protein